MKTFTVALAVLAAAGMLAYARTDIPSQHSSRAAVLGPHGNTRKTPSVTINLLPAMPCPECKTVTVAVKRDIGTKPGHGTEIVHYSVDACPGCHLRMVSKLTSTSPVHVCTMDGVETTRCCTPTSPKRIPKAS